MQSESLGFLHLNWIDLLDILMVAVIIYFVFRWIRGSSAINIFIAVIIVMVIKVIVSALGMRMMNTLLGTIIDVGAVALIVIFQPEVRRFLNNVGRRAGDTFGRQNFFSRLFTGRMSNAVSNPSVNEIGLAVDEMSEQKTGALIVIRRQNTLEDIINTGDIIDAHISSRLIMNIFFKNSPLHDGAMIISGDRIVAARCTLPMTDRTDLPARYGMRHKAAVGLSEQSDADVIVVSEETGQVSFVRAGNVKRIMSLNELKLLLGEKVE